MTTSKTPKPRDGIVTESYRGPSGFQPDILRLDGNEGSKPDRALLASVPDIDISAVRSYPSTAALEAVLAARFGVSAERIVVTTGADDALDRICRAYLDHGRNIILPTPSFEMLARFATNAGGSITEVPWDSDFPTDACIKAITPTTPLLALVTPNNPSGKTIPIADIRRIANRAPGTMLLLDMAYVEYANFDPTEELLDLDNVVIVRTLSKAWGLAGLRIGYAIAPTSVASILRNIGNPFPVSGLSLELAIMRLKEAEPQVHDHIARVKTERELLQQRLQEQSIHVSPSEGNFVFADLGERAEFFTRALASKGIAVRTFPHRRELSGGVRISLPGDDAEFTQLMNALESTLNPEALIFDLDGVLADVEGSYRSCIISVAAHYGVQIDRRDVENAVMEGQANNDWILTQRILASFGVDISLDDITATYQSKYLGDGTEKGLRETEKLLVSREWFANLTSHFRLGIVTGRPRAEAEWFLDRFEVRQFFDAIVCMEDGPLKPDPSPVKTALERLGVQHAWMFGDTPDDIRAAVGAGVIPVGVIAPGDIKDTVSPVLQQAGAATVLNTVTNMDRLLS